MTWPVWCAAILAVEAAFTAGVLMEHHPWIAAALLTLGCAAFVAAVRLNPQPVQR